MELNNKATLEKANTAIAKGDNEGFLFYCSEDCKWTFVGEQILQGKEAIRQYMKKTYLEPPKFEIENLISEGDYVTAIGKISIKDAVGKSVNYDYCDVWRFHDGKMAELKAFVIRQ